MNSPETENIFQHAAFGRRKVTPRVCIADSKQHIRTFLSEALEELGFIAGECRQVADLRAFYDKVDHIPRWRGMQRIHAARTL